MGGQRNCTVTVGALAMSLSARYSGGMRLALGDKGHGPSLRHVAAEDWTTLAERESQSRWLAFGGEGGTVWLRLSIRDGRTVATGMLIGSSAPLSVADLRAIPFGRLLDLAAIFADDALRMAVPADQLDRMALEGVAPLALPKVGKRPGRRGHSRERLDQIAEVWARARKTHPHRPMAETAERLNYSVAQARRLVRRAESEGLVTTNSNEEEA